MEPETEKTEKKRLCPPKIQRRVASLVEKLRVLEERYRAVLGAIVDYRGKDQLGHARRLCQAGLDGGSKRGTIQWSFTSRILGDPKITGFCDWCGINCYGSKSEPAVMPCEVAGCPYEAAGAQRPAISAAVLEAIEAAADRSKGYLGKAASA